MIIVTNPDAIAAQNGYPAGIVCKENESGQLVLTAWPSSLPHPTQAEVEVWEAAHDTGEAVEAVKVEAEKRIAAGVVLSSGVRFKCDETSIARLTGMTLSNVWPKTFKTDAGVTVTLNSQAEAQAVFNECDAFITDILSKSAVLQANPPADPTDDSHWN